MRRLKKWWDGLIQEPSDRLLRDGLFLMVMLALVTFLALLAEGLR